MARTIYDVQGNFYERLPNGKLVIRKGSYNVKVCGRGQTDVEEEKPVKKCNPLNPLNELFKK